MLSGPLSLITGRLIPIILKLFAGKVNYTPSTCAMKILLVK
jgi:hypothetical protein